MSKESRLCPVIGVWCPIGLPDPYVDKTAPVRPREGGLNCPSGKHFDGQLDMEELLVAFAQLPFCQRLVYFRPVCRG